MPTINGNNQDNTITGSSGDDRINARAGDDYVDGLAGDDTINGSSGGDTLIGGLGDDELDGGSGDDELDGGEGHDTLDGGSGDDTMSGGDGNDDLTGLSGDDEIDGGSGADTIDSGAGDDTVSGGEGDDIIEAGSGHDSIDGGAGADLIEAGSGNDTITSGDGDDTIIGGSGDDVAIFSGSITDYTITTVSGVTTVAGNAGQGTDNVSGVETLVFDDYTPDLTGGNNAPVALDDALSGDEDTQIVGNVLADNGNGADFDFEGDALSVIAAVITTANGGTVTLLADGSFTYDPAENFNGSDSFTYSVTDGIATSTGTVNLTVNAVNDAPVAADDAFTGDEDTQILGNVLADNGQGADSDLDGDNLSVVAAVITTANGGTVNLLADGSFTYDPAENFNGLDSFSYTLTDGTLTDTATVNLTINAVNDAPVANDDAFSGDEDTQIIGNVLDDNGNGADSDVEGDSLSVVAAVITTANGGTVNLLVDGSFTYDPAENYNGPDSFSYTLTDGNLTDTATVNLTINAVNDAPVANDDAFSGNEDTQITGNVLDDNGNGADSDVDGDGLSVVAAVITTANGGTVNLLADGSFTYDPAENYNGPDSFSYTLTDGNLTSIGTVNLSVAAVNDAAVANPDTVNTAVDTDVDINVLANDTDVENDTLSVVSFTQPEFGTVVETSPGIFTYTPQDGFTGSDAFSYTITDGNGETSTAEVIVSVGEVTGENTAPLALSATIDAVIDDGATNVLTVDFNTMTVNGQPIISDAEQSISQLDITSLTVRNNERIGAQFVETSPGSNVFTLDLDALNVEDGGFLGLEIDYTVDDGQGSNNQSSGLISLIVNNPDDEPENTAPVAGDATITQTEADGLITINLAAALGLATDADGDPLSVTSLVFTDALGNPLAFDPLEAGGTEESGGIVNLDPNVFGLADTVTGTFLLQYTVSDGTASDSGVVTINLTGSSLNAAPTTTAASETRTLPDDILLSSNNISFNLNQYVDDVDQDTLTISLVSITDSLGNTIPVTVAGNDIGSDGIVTGTIVDGIVTINVAELELDPEEILEFVINYTVSDGTNPPVAGTLDATVIGPDETPTGNVIEDFESYSSSTGSSITITDIAGLSFEGSATVIEVDELGGRAAPGLITGETTIEESDTVANGNAAVITGNFIGYDDDDLPEYAFTAFAPGASSTLDAAPIFTFTPETIFGAAFDLESMSLTALTGPMTTVTIVPYRVEEVSPNQYQYVAVGEFEVSVSSTSANMLDFTSGQFNDAFIFDDPLTSGVVETSAFENIVAFQIITTGSLVESNTDNPANAGTTPLFDDPLVIDDLVFIF